MCGRIACTLCSEDIRKAVQQYSNGVNPAWIEQYKWQKYIPKYNMSPASIVPVLVMQNLVGFGQKHHKTPIIFPMRWGLLPIWFKGSPVEEFSYTNYNCRKETILERPTYKYPMKRGRRCVVLADGYYEWKDCGKDGKKAEFIHFSNAKGIEMSQRTFAGETFCIENGSWNGPRLLTMAAIFDASETPKGRIYSCAILTMDSSTSVADIHNRMPVVLDGSDAVNSWLNSTDIKAEKALANIQPVQNLAFYPVSSLVNNCTNNTVECIQPHIPCKSSTSGTRQLRINDMFQASQSKKMKH